MPKRIPAVVGLTPMAPIERMENSLQKLAVCIKACGAAPPASDSSKVAARVTTTGILTEMDHLGI
jgi:hypothetical protein